MLGDSDDPVFYWRYRTALEQAKPAYQLGRLGPLLRRAFHATVLLITMRPWMIAGVAIGVLIAILLLRYFELS